VALFLFGAVTAVKIFPGSNSDFIILFWFIFCLFYVLVDVLNKQN